MGETWEEGESCQEQNYEVTYVHEFRYEYDQPRARYMEATRDCEDPEDVVDTVWTDYMGGTVYGDFTVVEDEGSPVYTDLNAFLPGIGRVDPHGTASAVEYYHSNQIGTTRAMTDDGGDDEQGVVYTAFGERIDGTDHRYGYAGAWGYRSHDDFACDAQSPEYQFPYLHVGYRYYDPANGRFLQRDPIGIEGGLNVYEYVHSRPTLRVDPTGLDGITVNGEEMPDPDGPGDRWSKRREYYRRRMHQLGWAGCSMIDFLNPVNIWKFYEHTCKVHAEAVTIYPDPPPVASPKPSPKPKPKPKPKPPPPKRPPPACFVGGTLVWTPDGPKAIEKVTEGDAVFSWDFDSESLAVGQVTGVLHGGEQEIISVQTTTETLRCSSEHKFFVQERGWLPASELMPGQRIQTNEGVSIPVIAVTCDQHDEIVRTHNLEVFPYSNFFVGKGRVLAHNINWHK